MNLTSVGYISKTHGLKGHCILKMKDNLFLDEESVNAIFLEIQGSLAPYFIEELAWNNSGYILKLETIDSIEQAKKLVGKACSVNPDFIEEDEDPMQAYVGYTLVDHAHGTVGIIEEIISNTANVLIRITHQGKEVLLPFADDLIEAIDEDKKQVLYRAPEGLIEMYLS